MNRVKDSATPDLHEVDVCEHSYKLRKERYYDYYTYGSWQCGTCGLNLAALYISYSTYTQRDGDPTRCPCCGAAGPRIHSTGYPTWEREEVYNLQEAYHRLRAKHPRGLSFVDKTPACLRWGSRR